MRHLQQQDNARYSTVSAEVAGRVVWFTAEGARLRADLIPWILAFHLSARKTQRGFRTDRQVDLSQVPRLHDAVRLTDEWWGLGPAPHVRTGKEAAPPPAKGQRTALMFSCGVDSFDAALSRLPEIDDLVLVHGFDIALAEAERFAALEARARAVANTLGKRLIVVRTNLRENRLFQKGSWVKNHGSALAAVGHLLSDEINRLFIAASYPSRALLPWGSHPLLDHLWSSTHLKIEHVGDADWRLEKIARSGGHPLVQQHLSVCWKGSGLPLNCGFCEKCVRNQLAFRLCGHAVPASFPIGVDLEQSLRAIPQLKITSSVYSMTVASDRFEPSLRAEVAALLERSNSTEEQPKAEGVLWSAATVASRIEDASKHRRFEGGSPNPEEVAAYARHFPNPELCGQSTAVILGMTPELRRLAAENFARVVSIDRGKAAIDAYGDWLPTELAARETIYSADWSQLRYIDWSVLPPVRAVLGDGIFGNLLSIQAHRDLLLGLCTLFPHAILVIRKALALEAGASDAGVLDALRAAFRAEQIDAAEFGFSVRLQGFLNSHYDANSALLDNASLFRECDRLTTEGFFDPSEAAAIAHYRFEGRNCLLTAERWEALLTELSLSFVKTQLLGKRWYAYYPLYQIGRSQAEKERE